MSPEGPEVYNNKSDYKARKEDIKVIPSGFFVKSKAETLKMAPPIKPHWAHDCIDRPKPKQHWGWKPEEYFNRENTSMNEHMITGTDTLRFIWHSNGGPYITEVFNPVRYRKEPDGMTYFTKGGNEFYVKNTWDVKINVVKS